MIDQVRASLSNLSKSERAVAETILADPEHSVHLSIARLAVAAGVSEPTVNRFVDRLAAGDFLISNCDSRKRLPIQPPFRFAVWTTVIRFCNLQIKCSRPRCLV